MQPIMDHTLFYSRYRDGDDEPGSQAPSGPEPNCETEFRAALRSVLPGAPQRATKMRELQTFHELRAAIVFACVKKGDRVRHIDFGLALVTKVNKKTGAITIMLPEGIEGTTTAGSLLRAAQ